MKRQKDNTFQFDDYLANNEKKIEENKTKKVLEEKFNADFELTIPTQSKIENFALLIQKVQVKYPTIFESFSQRLDVLKNQLKNQVSICSVCKNKKPFETAQQYEKHILTKTHQRKKVLSNFFDKIDQCNNRFDLQALWEKAKLDQPLEEVFEENVDDDQIISNVKEVMIQAIEHDCENDDDEEIESDQAQVVHLEESLLDGLMNEETDVLLLHPHFIESTQPSLETPRFGGIFHHDILTRVYYTLFALNHGRPFSAEIMGSLLRVASYPSLVTIAHCASSIYYLNKSGLYFSPKIQQHSLKLDSGYVSYFDLGKLVAFLLSKKEITSNWVSLSSDAPNFHCARGAGIYSSLSLLLLKSQRVFVNFLVLLMTN